MKFHPWKSDLPETGSAQIKDHVNLKKLHLHKFIPCEKFWHHRDRHSGVHQLFTTRQVTERFLKCGKCKGQLNTRLSIMTIKWMWMKFVYYSIFINAHLYSGRHYDSQQPNIISLIINHFFLMQTHILWNVIYLIHPQ